MHFRIKNKLIILIIAVQFFGWVEMQKLTGQISISQEQIGNGLKQALHNGIKNQVSKLAKKDGFFKNELVKITLPPELKKVDKKLRKIGLGSLADQGILVLNRAAEDAIKTAIPIFINAVKTISFDDAKDILLGSQNAATLYLQNRTTTSLYKKFNPIIKNSLSKAGADKIWNELTSTYNRIPFVKKVTPDLTDYVTTQTLKGVFTMIEIEEKGIREKIGLRNTDVLRSIFALQDK